MCNGIRTAVPRNPAGTAACRCSCIQSVQVPLHVAGALLVDPEAGRVSALRDVVIASGGAVVPPTTLDALRPPDHGQRATVERSVLAQDEPDGPFEQPEWPVRRIID